MSMQEWHHQDFPEVTQLPTDDEIIYDWKRHDAFRFRSVLFPILLILVFTAGQWTSSPWIQQLTVQQQYFEHWGDLQDLIQSVWFTRIIFFAFAPLGTILFCNPLPSRLKMRVVISLALSGLLLQSIAFINASRGMFLFTVAITAFSFGLSFHTIVITLLNWFPDFSIFVFAAVALSTIASHWLTIAIGEYFAKRFALPALPIAQGIVFMFTVIPLHFFIQSPPAYIPLFIRAMLHAAALPQSKTLPLPTTLGLAARIPRAMGKIQQWKRKIKNKNARQGYGQLVNEDDENPDYIEEIEMQVADGFDNDLGDLYNDISTNAGTYNSVTSKQQQQAKKTKTTKNNNNSSNNNNNKSQASPCGLNQVAIDISLKDVDPNDPLMAAAKGMSTANYSLSNNNSNAQQNQQNQQQNQQKQQQPTTIHNSLQRPSDCEDDGDPAFAFDDVVSGNEVYHNTNNNNNNNNNNTTTTATTTHLPQNNTSNHSQPHSPAASHTPYTDESSYKAQQEQRQRHAAQLHTAHANYRKTVGFALHTVVSHTIQYNPLTTPELLNLRSFQYYLGALCLPLLFPFFLLHLTPTIYIHLQNRTFADATAVFESTIKAVMLIAAFVLIAAQFLGNKGILTMSSVLILFGTIFWTIFITVGGQHDPSDAIKSRSLSPIHVLIGVIHLGAAIYTFLSFTVIHKYFHGENVRITSAITISTLAFTYLFSTIVLLPFREALKESTWTPATFVAINAQAYDWVSRIACLCTVVGMVCLYRLVPLSMHERRVASGSGDLDQPNDVEEGGELDEAELKKSPYHNESTIIQSVNNTSRAALEQGMPVVVNSYE